MRARAFRLALAAIGLLAFAVRLAYGLSARDPGPFGDDRWYHTVANNIAGGRGFSTPFYSVGATGEVVLGTAGDPVATAFHLPLFPAVLAIGSELGADTYRAHQAIGWALGAGTVVVIGLVARRLAGQFELSPRPEALGLVAAGIAALYVPLVVNDSLLMSESLYGLLIALTLLAGLRVLERPSAGRCVALGVALGLAALTRQEALVLTVLLLPVVWRAGAARVRNAALVLGAVVLLTAPWALRNSLEFDQPVLLTTGDGSVIGCANQHETYYGGLVGGCNHDIGATRGGRTDIRNEGDRSDLWRDDGLDYAADHAGRVPVVVAARVARTWSVYPLSPRAKAQYGAFLYRRIEWLEYVSMALFAVVLALAVAALALVRRRPFPVWLFAAPLVLVTATSALGYGETRFRQAAEVSLVVLAAVGAELLWRRRSGERRTAPASVDDSARISSTTAPTATQ
jgi:hypothetical protein